MAAPKGNEFWKMRSRHGTNQICTDPKKLQEACAEYFQWCHDNPLTSKKVGFSNGKAVTHEVEHIRAMTSSALSLFLGITHKTLIEWKKHRDDLKPVLEWAEMVIRNQKFTGAAAGLLNAGIIARELGLADKQTIDIIVPRMVINPPSGNQPLAPPIHGEE